jgi:hypothetical protein
MMIKLLLVGGILAGLQQWACAQTTEPAGNAADVYLQAAKILRDDDDAKNIMDPASSNATFSHYYAPLPDDWVKMEKQDYDLHAQVRDRTARSGPCGVCGSADSLALCQRCGRAGRQSSFTGQQFSAPAIAGRPAEGTGASEGLAPAYLTTVLRRHELLLRPVVAPVASGLRVRWGHMPAIGTGGNAETASDTPRGLLRLRDKRERRSESGEDSICA